MIAFDVVVVPNLELSTGASIIPSYDEWNVCRAHGEPDVILAFTGGD